MFVAIAVRIAQLVKKEASDAIALAIEFVKYGLNKLDN